MNGVSKFRKWFLFLGCKQSDIFSTSHGKGACDGVGGTVGGIVNCLAARASLQRPYVDQILTPY